MSDDLHKKLMDAWLASTRYRKKKRRRLEVKRVIIESPYSAPSLEGTQLHEKYAEACLLDSLNRDEAPFANHLLYTRVLDDRMRALREQGLRAAMMYVQNADLVAVYTDHGVSRGMVRGIRKAQEHGVPIEYRVLTSLRQTGRTRWMVKMAVDAALDGKRVLVLAADTVHARQIVEMKRELLAPLQADSSTVKSVNLVVEVVDPYRLRGALFDEVFVDHHTWHKAPLTTWDVMCDLHMRS